MDLGTSTRNALAAPRGSSTPIAVRLHQRRHGVRRRQRPPQPRSGRRLPLARRVPLRHSAPLGRRGRRLPRQRLQLRRQLQLQGHLHLHGHLPLRPAVVRRPGLFRIPVFRQQLPLQQPRSLPLAGAVLDVCDLGALSVSGGPALRVRAGSGRGRLHRPRRRPAVPILLLLRPPGGPAPGRHFLVGPLTCDGSSEWHRLGRHQWSGVSNKQRKEPYPNLSRPIGFSASLS